MSDQFDKPSKSEDEYFHRRDRELLEQKRRAEAEVTARQALASALGITNDELMRRLTAQGITPELTVLLPWLPAIQVAWLKSLTSAERDWLVDHIKTTQTPPLDAAADAPPPGVAGHQSQRGAVSGRAPGARAPDRHARPRRRRGAARQGAQRRPRCQRRVRRRPRHRIGVRRREGRDRRARASARRGLTCTLPSRGARLLSGGAST